MTDTVPHSAIVGSDPRPALTLLWRSEADTEACAQRLAQQMAQTPALRDAVIALEGELGAGKTTFVRHLLRALGVQGRIKSPTYAVVEPHETQLGGRRLSIWHFDCYRFNDAREFDDAGFRDLFASPGLKLVEWPDKAQGALPTPDLQMSLFVDAEERRHVTLRSATPRGEALLRNLSAATP